MNVDSVKQSVIHRFMDRAVKMFGMVPKLMANPTEELVEQMQRRGSAKIFLANGMGMGATARLEENYLFDTRRFPEAVDNAIGAGALTPGDRVFFANAVGQRGDANGFPTGFTLSEAETNMDVGGQIAQGKNFVFNQIGVSFNAEALSDNIEQLLDAGALRFTKQGGQYTLKHGVLRLWPGGTGVAGFSTRDTTESAHNGSADIRAVRKLYVPRVLKEKEVFQYIYTVPRATRQTNGVAWGLSDFVLMSVWLWGGQKDSIPV